MTTTARKWFSISVGIAVSALLVWALIHKIDFVQLWAALKSANGLTSNDISAGQSLCIP